MACLAATVVIAATITCMDSGAVNRHFGRMVAEGLQYSTERLRALILSTTATLLTFEVTDEAEDWKKLDECYRELGTWMEATKAALMTDEEGAIFGRIYDAYTRYLA